MTVHVQHTIFFLKPEYLNHYSIKKLQEEKMYTEFTQRK
jgi:hypothetical protein